MREITIGRQVYAAIPHEKEWDIKMDTTKVWTLESVKSYKEADDWCDHLIIKDEDLNEREVPEYEVVVAPDYGLPEDEMLYRYLYENGVYADVYGVGDDVEVSISWGDWKHEHGWAKTLMEYINYIETNCEVTEEDGSDCYSAVHTFHKFPEALVKFRQALIDAKLNATE